MRISKTPCYYNSVVQRLLTYGPFYKNVTNCGPLPIKWCRKQHIQKIWNWRREDKWVRHWTYFTLANSNLLKNLYQWGACGRDISDTIVPKSIPMLVVLLSETIVHCFDCNSISVFGLDNCLFIAENVPSYTYVFPNIESIFSVKSFSLGNLYLLINFQKLCTV